MYLYMFDTGDIWQMPLPPTEADRECVRHGTLHVFLMESGKYQQLNRQLKWETIPAGDRFSIENQDYSFVKDTNIVFEPLDSLDAL